MTQGTSLLSGSPADAGFMETSAKHFITDLVDEVGSLSAVATQIVAITSDPECDLEQLTRVILADNVMSLRFLALANSATFSRGGETRDLRDCLVRLGLNRVRNVALLMGVHDLGPGKGEVELDLNDFWHHSLATASCCRQMAADRDGVDPEDAWLVGILHGIGVIAMAQKVPDDFQNALLRARALQTTLAEAEMTILEFHHGELAGRILNQWHLPSLFSEAIEFHPESYEEHEVGEESDRMIGLLRDGIRLARALGCGDNGDGTPLEQPQRVAERIGLDPDRLEPLAASVVEEVGEFSRLLGMNEPCRPMTQDQSEETVEKATPNNQHVAARLALEGMEDTMAREDLEAQLDLARQIQQRLLPDRTPEIPGFELAAANHPCLHVSGDYYDFINMKGSCPALVIADVSGKGMPASLLASNLQASLRALAQIFDDPGELLANVNRALFSSTDPEHFATLFLAALEPDGSGFRYASAGHNPPLLLGTDGTPRWLPPAGTPLGMFEEMTYPVTTVAMEPGELLVAYTDGVTEACDNHEDEYTEDGLCHCVAHNFDQDCGAIARCIVEDVTAHVGARSSRTPGDTPGHLADDVTLLLLRRLGSS